MSLLEVRQIGKKEGEKTLLTDIDFKQQVFQHISIAGVTGSGKTTLMRIIAGLVQPTAGEILFEGSRVEGPDEKLIPGHPAIAYLSQHFELRNHYHVEELIEMNNHLAEKDAGTICRLCRIDHLLNRWTHQLSGGEKQRIALACLLVKSPKLLLLDEPYSNLDLIHKNILKTVINDVSEHLEMSCILVAHDPMDILPWAGEIIVLREGRMVQKATPRVIYREPLDDYVAGIFGKFNRLTPKLAKQLSSFGDILPEQILRPEDFEVSHAAGSGIEALVLTSGFLGSTYELTVQIDNSRLTVYSDRSFEKNEPAYISLRSSFSTV